MTDLPDRRIDLEFGDNRLLPRLYGEYDSHLARIEAQVGVTLLPRGNVLTVVGPAEAAATARGVLDGLWERLKRGQPVGPAEVDAAIRLATAPVVGAERPAVADLSLRTRRRAVTPRSAGQAAYLKTLMSHDLVFAIGPAGTGKTYLAVAQAVALLMSRQVERIVLSRPAVEAGERLGFLPGDLKEKVDPYLRPLYDALYDMMPAEQVAKRLDSGEIEVAPLAFMRGRTLGHAFVILDEGQNTTPMQMKMFLTRLGEGGRMVVTGDITQVDLPAGVGSGLVDALAVLDGVPGVGVVHLTAADVVRHPMVRAIVQAYDTRDATRRRTAPDRAAPASGLEADEDGDGQDGPSSGELEVILEREAGAWDDAAAATAERAARHAVAAMLAARPDPVELGITLTDNAACRDLNHRFRHQDKPTNVLSFPLNDPLPPPGSGPLMLGDVVLAFETVAAEAAAEGKPLNHHVAHLTIHGVLHLLGHDHDTDDAATRMEALETHLLAELGIPDPYRAPPPGDGAPTAIASP